MEPQHSVCVCVRGGWGAGGMVCVGSVRQVGNQVWCKKSPLTLGGEEVHGHGTERC